MSSPRLRSAAVSPAAPTRPPRYAASSGSVDGSKCTSPTTVSTFGASFGRAPPAANALAGTNRIAGSSDSTSARVTVSANVFVTINGEDAGRPGCDGGSGATLTTISPVTARKDTRVRNSRPLSNAKTTAPSGAISSSVTSATTSTTATPPGGITASVACSHVELEPSPSHVRRRASRIHSRAPDSSPSGARTTTRDARTARIVETARVIAIANGFGFPTAKRFVLVAGAPTTPKSMLDTVLSSAHPTTSAAAPAAADSDSDSIDAAIAIAASSSTHVSFPSYTLTGTSSVVTSVSNARIAVNDAPARVGVHSSVNGDSVPSGRTISPKSTSETSNDAILSSAILSSSTPSIRVTFAERNLIGVGNLFFTVTTLEIASNGPSPPSSGSGEMKLTSASSIASFP